MKKILLKLFTLLSVLFTANALSQNQKEIIEKSVTDFFKLDRENIHVQYDKAVFTVNEKIWFKGYVFNRKENLPFLATTNIIASLMDDSGKVLETQLLYCNQGAFQGNFTLNEKMISGDYYIQYYTNWMNNFGEDESFVSHVKIVNQALGAGNVFFPADPSKINIALHPEGGTLVANVTNIVGLQISDCNGDTAGITTADLTDANGNVLKKLQLNKLGFGRFDIQPQAGTVYKIVVNTEHGKHEQPLPVAVTTGVALEANNFSAPDKTIITVRMSEATAKQRRSLILLVHKDNKNNIYDIKPEKGTETKIAISNSDLADGINTIRVLDESLNELAQRIIFKYPTQALTTALERPGSKTENNSIEYTGKINHPGMFNLSISVLPENSMCIDQESDIYSSIWLLPYVENQHSANGKHYFSALSRGKAYELDLYLLSQKSKYDWNKIKTNVPVEKYTFDRGLSLKGTVPIKMVNTHADVRLFSVTGIDLTSKMDATGKFNFENLVVPDSLHINLSVINKGTDPKSLVIKPLTTNGIQPYYKMYKPVPRCFISSSPESFASTKLPETIGSITLDETVIQKTRLKYARGFGNSNLTGHKIEDMDTNAYHSVTQYIAAKGNFEVQQVGIARDTQILSRGGPVSIHGGYSQPIIYLNNMQILDHNQLNMISLDEVDEIYMNPTTLVPSLRNFRGIIKIYLKPYMNTPGKKSKTPDIIITGAYRKIMPFANINYSNTYDKGFQNFGVIDWNSQIMTSDNGEFKFSIPPMGPENVKVLIEGFSADGKLISEIQTLKLN